MDDVPHEVAELGVLNENQQLFQQLFEHQLEVGMRYLLEHN